ncbi:hypothetical protein KKA85_00930 [bacterium]|nr:hypothetical protein [bacterium]MBU1674323.1 hypothetical protein [bacterium]
MNSSVRAAALLAIPACLCAAAAAGGHEMEDGWLFPVEWTISSTEGAAPRVDGSWAACGTGRLFEMPELTQHYLGLKATRDDGFVVAGWQILGADMWRERLVRLEAGWGRSLGASLAWTLRGTDGWGGASTSRQELASALRASLGDDFHLTIRSAPISLTRDAAASRQSRWLNLRGRAGAVAWAVAVDRRRDDAPTLRVAMLARCVPGLALGFLAEPDTGTLGMTTAWVRGGLVLRTSHLAHPALGITHRWMLVLRRTSG